MKKLFEDYFTELQADMVSICLEYIENLAEDIFIYCSFEDNVVSSGFFYKINGKILKKNKVNDEISKGEPLFDVSPQRQKATTTIINENIKKLIKLCEEYGHNMPTQIKLVYNVENNSLTADYQYESIYSKNTVKTAYDVIEEWINEEILQEH